MPFEKAEIKVEKQKEFGELRAAIEQMFSPAEVGRFLKKVQREGVRIRDLDAVLARNLLNRATYQALPVSDQAQIREFYLSLVEKVEPQLRQKYHKIYQYY